MEKSDRLFSLDALRGFDMLFKKFFSVLLALSANVVSADESLLCDRWLFSRDRATWEVVCIPHDWAIAGPFSAQSPMFPTVRFSYNNQAHPVC